jgi:ABC-type iron transport system FetAB permease component
VYWLLLYGIFSLPGITSGMDIAGQATNY